MKTKTIKSLTEVLHPQNKKLLSLYYTMGYPDMESILPVVEAIYNSGKVDFMELGMPYSDPLADGETIQMSSSVAIKNGITLEKYFDFAVQIRSKFPVPLVFMGYYNAVYQIGIESFCKKCQDAGIEGVIIPDMPLEIYETQVKVIFEQHDLLSCFLITPTTSEKRIRKIEELTIGFIYVVSSNSITGKKGAVSEAQLNYYRFIKSLNLSKPSIMGFGIHDQESFENATQYANGAIIGSEFIRVLSKSTDKQHIIHFLNSIKP